MLPSMGQSVWATVPRYLVNVILDVSVKVFLEEIDIKIGGP